MPLFICDNCDTIENTACCWYWSRNDKSLGHDGRALCSVCEPTIGKWHGRFPRQFATEETVKSAKADYFRYAGRFESIRLEQWREEYHAEGPSEVINRRRW